MKDLLKSIGMTALLCFAIGCQPPVAPNVGPSSSKRLMTFAVRTPYVTDTGSGARTVSGVIDENNHTVTVDAPGGSDVSSTWANFSFTGKSLLVNGTAQQSGVTLNDFTAPVTYTVVAADDSTQDYTVTVNVAPNNWKTITAFDFIGVDDVVEIVQSPYYTIAAQVPWGTDVTALVAAFTATGPLVTVNGVSQESGVTANDFTEPVVYRVTAADDTYRDYTMTVTVDAPGAIWARSTTGDDQNRGVEIFGVATDASGNAYIAGEIGSSQYSFGQGVTVQGLFSENCVLVKYDAAGHPLWARTESGGFASFNDVCADAAGNAYAVGKMGTTATFGTVLVSGTGGVLIVKYDTAGNAQWASTNTTGAGSAYYYGAAVDAAGNTYAVGTVYGTTVYTFGAAVIAQGTLSYGGESGMIVKYNADGIAQWARAAAGSGAQSRFKRVTVDPSGNVCAVGYIEGTGALDFGNGIGVTNVASVKNILIVKYDASGNALWARTLEAAVPNSWSEYNAVATDASGNLYAAGQACDEDISHLGGGGSFPFGPGVSAGSFLAHNPILVKYDQNGNAVWARSALTRPYGYFSGVAVNNAGNVYATGTLGVQANFGAGIVTFGGGSSWSALIVAYEQDGTCRWGRSVANVSDQSEFIGTAFGGSSGVYAAGYITGTGQYAFSPGVSAAGSCEYKNPVLVKYPVE